MGTPQVRIKERDEIAEIIVNRLGSLLQDCKAQMLVPTAAGVETELAQLRSNWVGETMEPLTTLPVRGVKTATAQTRATSAGYITLHSLNRLRAMGYGVTGRMGTGQTVWVIDPRLRILD